MLQREKHRLASCIQDIGRFLTKPKEKVSEVHIREEVATRARAQNFYDHTYRLLQSAGAFENGHLGDPKDEVFFTERVAASFLEGLFPRGNNRSINGRRNKIDSPLHLYLRDRLPMPLTFAKEDRKEDQLRQVFVEKHLDYVAYNVYQELYLDLLQRHNADQLADYFLAALKGLEMPLSNEPTIHVKRRIQNTLRDYQKPQSDFGTEK